MKEEEKLPPNYAEIDLYNENEDILFEAELMKYKPGYTGTFVSRYIQVTESAIRIYRNRAFALSQSHKPLLAIPVEAFLKVERVDFDLKIVEKNQARFQDYQDNQFEIFLKDDFIDYYVNLEMDRIQSSPQKVPKQKRDTVPQAAEFTSILGTSTLAVPKPRVSAAGASPFKVREIDGKTHVMDQTEMHDRFVKVEEGEEIITQKNMFSKGLMIKDTWTSREEIWYFSNKRLLFSAKYPEIVDKWVDSLSQLVTPVIPPPEEQ